MSIKISSQFDAGAIDIVNATSANAIDLNIRKDSHADITQWFYFRLQGAQAQPCTIRLLNAGQSAYPKGWEDYNAMASYDRINWFRVPTSFDGQVLSIEHTPAMDSVYYAYFEPYSWERHLELLDRAQQSDHVRMLDLGSTIDGRDLNMLVIGEPAPEKKKVWVIARQHPGETMAEWFVEGMLDALLDPAHPFGRQLLKETVFYVVPNMNPDGSVRGNLRTNAAGANLNREWLNPSMERSPEVFLVLQKMHETGVDMCLDVHGDEGLPYVFVAGSESLPNFTDRTGRGAESLLGCLHDRQPGLPGRAWLRRNALQRRNADHGLAAHHPRLRLPVADPGTAVQGQRQRPRSAGRLGRRAQRPPRRRRAAAGAAGGPRDQVRKPYPRPRRGTGLRRPCQKHERRPSSGKLRGTGWELCIGQVKIRNRGRRFPPDWRWATPGSGTPSRPCCRRWSSIRGSRPSMRPSACSASTAPA
jgi:murein tripeptide amidase MpaA